jgi:hypothetical protein
MTISQQRLKFSHHRRQTCKVHWKDALLTCIFKSNRNFGKVTDMFVCLFIICTLFFCSLQRQKKISCFIETKPAVQAHETFYSVATWSESFGSKTAGGTKLTTHLRLVPKLRICIILPLFPLGLSLLAQRTKIPTLQREVFRIRNYVQKASRILRSPNTCSEFAVEWS